MVAVAVAVFPTELVTVANRLIVPNGFDTVHGPNVVDPDNAVVLSAVPLLVRLNETALVELHVTLTVDVPSLATAGGVADNLMVGSGAGLAAGGTNTVPLK